MASILKYVKWGVIATTVITVITGISVTLIYAGICDAEKHYQRLKNVIMNTVTNIMTSLECDSVYGMLEIEDRRATANEVISFVLGHVITQLPIEYHTSIRYDINLFINDRLEGTLK